MFSLQIYFFYSLVFPWLFQAKFKDPIYLNYVLSFKESLFLFSFIIIFFLIYFFKDNFIFKIKNYKKIIINFKIFRFLNIFFFLLCFLNLIFGDANYRYSNEFKFLTIIYDLSDIYFKFFCFILIFYVNKKFSILETIIFISTNILYITGINPAITSLVIVTTYLYVNYFRLVSYKIKFFLILSCFSLGVLFSVLALNAKNDILSNSNKNIFFSLLKNYINIEYVISRFSPHYYSAKNSIIFEEKYDFQNYIDLNLSSAEKILTGKKIFSNSLNSYNLKRLIDVNNNYSYTNLLNSGASPGILGSVLIHFNNGVSLIIFPMLIIILINLNYHIFVKSFYNNLIFHVIGLNVLFRIFYANPFIFFDIFLYLLPTILLFILAIYRLDIK